VARAEADGLDAEAALRAELRRVEAVVVAAETARAEPAGT
jgi:XTP/dITP diphosphohydrolase